MVQLGIVFDDNDDATDLPSTKRPESAPATVRQARPRGFAAMDPEKRKAIASKGGRAAHRTGKAHRFTADEARAAGKKGGNAPHVRWGRKRT